MWRSPMQCFKSALSRGLGRIPCGLRGNPSGALGAFDVIDGIELVDLFLQIGDRGGERSFVEPVEQGLVEAVVLSLGKLNSGVEVRAGEGATCCCGVAWRLLKDGGCRGFGRLYLFGLDLGSNNVPPLCSMEESRP